MSTALPSVPAMNTGLRPIRSASVASSGIAPSATTLAGSPPTAWWRGRGRRGPPRTTARTRRRSCSPRRPWRPARRAARRPSGRGTARRSAVRGADRARPRVNTGVSSSVRRMMNATTTTIADSQNGTRQPQDSSASSGIAATGRNTAVARIDPAWVPLRVKLVKNARRWSGACSRLIELAPACSPPAERPCTSRSTTSSTGARVPIWL